MAEGNKRIGFIGLGRMGSAMVERLMARGHTLHLLANRERANVAKAVEAGATEHASARDLAAASEIVMLCVDSSRSVESRMLGKDGVVAGLRKGATIIDCGTSLPSSTRSLGEEVAKAGGTYLDCPVGGTPAQAREGRLDIMAGGPRDKLVEVGPVLRDLSANVFHLGPLGAGHTVKLLHDFVSISAFATLGEAFAACDGAGIEREALYDVLSSGQNGSPLLDLVKAFVVDGDPDRAAFSIDNAARDIGYYQTMSHNNGIASLMADAARSRLDTARQAGEGGKTVTEIVDTVKRF